MSKTMSNINGIAARSSDGSHDQSKVATVNMLCDCDLWQDVCKIVEVATVHRFIAVIARK